MNRLIKIEFRKQVASISFWILLGLHMIAIFLSVVNFQRFIQNAQFSINNVPEVDLSVMPLLTFPDIWHNMTYVAGFFKIILALIVINSVTSEMNNKTIRQNIIDGLSRSEFFFSKALLASFLAVVSTMVIFISIWSIGTYNQDPGSPVNALEGSGFIIAYFFELFTYFIYALFISFLIRRTGMALVLLILMDLIFEPMLSWFIPDVVYNYLPMASVDNLIRFPFFKYLGNETALTVSPVLIIVVALYAVLFSAASLLWLKRADL